MNEITAPTPQSVSPFSGEVSFIAAQRMAKALSTSTLLPEIYRGPDNIGNVLIALEMTQRIGCSFMTVAQNLHIIHGRPSFAASFLIASVNASGRFTPLRFEFSGEGETRGCRARSQDKASGEVCEGTIVTVALAKSQGWWARAGSKWPAMTEQMLTYRAAAFWVRIYCPEIALGMHTTEELQDTPLEPAKPEIKKVQALAVPEVPATSTPAPFVPVTVSPIAPAADPAVAPAADPAPAQTLAESDELAALRTAVTAAFKKLGIAWEQVKQLAISDKWWDDADRAFKELGKVELDYLNSRAEKIAAKIKAATTPAT